MLKKLLIANRGEIALRIARACRELGIRSVAIYTDVDRYALHVKKADEAYHLGPDVVGGYLNAHRIVNIAKSTNCDAVHPGYGFLSESAEFAALCERSGLIFVGPSAEVIATMGDKIAARKAMQQAGIPVIPGSEGNLRDCDDGLAQAKAMGFPVMIKATGGGGGRGLRLCQREEDFANQFERARSEAEKSFASRDVFLEKYIDGARHIEVQVIGDAKQNVIHLFERDCSIQRRHQKLIEIAPSPQINEQQRQRICDLAIRAAQAVKYQNAGTVECILDKNDECYFLEMNTRLQVEHPVTEMITGIDIVQEQLRIASGLPLQFNQDQISRRGYAVEFRINAEDPQNDFLPSFGRVTRYYAPGGPGVRTDSAMYTGYDIPPDYDSLLAKVSVWALDWESLCARSERVLREMRLHGVKTTIPYYLAIVASDAFKNHDFDTKFVEQHPKLTRYSNRSLNHHKAAAIAAVLALHWGT